MKKAERQFSTVILSLIAFSLIVSACTLKLELPETDGKSSTEIYVEINGNVPEFTEEDYTTESFERYSELDALGRCGVAYANISQELMPKKEREEIGMIRPSGWQTVKYDCVDGKYLYNRCHLIGFQLAGENANEKNLITGTRYMNVEGMLPFENLVAEYVRETDHHVLYRVTPIYEGTNLVASGVEMEGWSVEDEGEGICFHVFVNNIQPGVGIDYATGESWLLTEESRQEQPGQTNAGQSGNVAAEEQNGKDGESQTGENEAADVRTYVINKNTRKFHLSSCESVKEMKEKNKKVYEGTREELIEQGYDPCQRCIL